jgi:hypothetical protein
MLETLTTIANRMLRPQEPTIAEMLSDSIVQAIMQADGVDPEALKKTLRDTAMHCASPYSPAAHRRAHRDLT